MSAAAPPASIPCPICGEGSELLSTYRGIAPEHGLEVELFRGRRVHRCGECGHGFCADELQPDVLERYYASFWQPSTPVGPLQGLRKRLAPARALLTALRDRLGTRDPRAEEQLSFPALRDWLRSHRCRSSLEVGAGPAGFSRLLRRVSPEVATRDVVEPSDDFAYLYRLSGIRRVQAMLEALPSSLSYDLVHMSHVVEHLVDPEQSLREVHELLSPAGAMMVEVPNCEEPYWKHRHHPDPPHVHFFTPVSMRRLLSKLGFAEVVVSTCGRRLDEEVGYLPVDAPELVPAAERQQLREQRAQRAAAQAAAPRSAASDYSEHGREFVRALAVKEG